MEPIHISPSPGQSPHQPSAPAVATAREGAAIEQLADQFAAEAPGLAGKVDLKEIMQLTGECCAADLQTDKFAQLGDKLHGAAQIAHTQGGGENAVNAMCRALASNIRQVRDAKVAEILKNDPLTDVHKQQISQILLHSTSALAQLEVTSLFNGKLPFHNVLHTTEVGTYSARLAEGVFPDTPPQAKGDSLMLFAGMTHDIRMRGYEKDNPFARKAGMQPEGSEGASFDRALEMLKEEQKSMLKAGGEKLQHLFSGTSGELSITGSMGANRQALSSNEGDRKISMGEHPMLNQDQMELLYRNIEGTVPTFRATALNGASVELFEEKTIDQSKVDREVLNNAKFMIVGIADLGSSSLKEVDANRDKSWVKGQTAGNWAEMSRANMEGATAIIAGTGTAEGQDKLAASYLGWMRGQIGFAKGRNQSMQKLYDRFGALSVPTTIPDATASLAQRASSPEKQCAQLKANLDKFYFINGKVSTANADAITQDFFNFAGVNIEGNVDKTFESISVEAPNSFNPKARAVDPSKLTPEVKTALFNEAKEVLTVRSGVVLTEGTREGFKAKMDSNRGYPFS